MPKAREACVKSLYEASITGDNPEAILLLALGRQRFTREARAYAERVMRAYLSMIRRVDEVIAAHLIDWSLGRVGKVEQAILRVAVTELLAFDSVPARVVIDEAVDLSKRYCDAEAPGFINGVLDAIARRYRPTEFGGEEHEEPG